MTHADLFTLDEASLRAIAYALYAVSALRPSAAEPVDASAIEPLLHSLFVPNTRRWSD